MMARLQFSVLLWIALVIIDVFFNHDSLINAVAVATVFAGLVLLSPFITRF
jgi:hypothetical protein